MFGGWWNALHRSGTRQTAILLSKSNELNFFYNEFLIFICGLICACYIVLQCFLKCGRTLCLAVCASLSLTVLSSLDLPLKHTWTPFVASIGSVSMWDDVIDGLPSGHLQSLHLESKKTSDRWSLKQINMGLNNDFVECCGDTIPNYHPHRRGAIPARRWGNNVWWDVDRSYLLSFRSDCSLCPQVKCQTSMPAHTPKPKIVRHYLASNERPCHVCISIDTTRLDSRAVDPIRSPTHPEQMTGTTEWGYGRWMPCNLWIPSDKLLNEVWNSLWTGMVFILVVIPSKFSGKMLSLAADNCTRSGWRRICSSPLLMVWGALWWCSNWTLRRTTAQQLEIVCRLGSTWYK